MECFQTDVRSHIDTSCEILRIPTKLIMCATRSSCRVLREGTRDRETNKRDELRMLKIQMENKDCEKE